MEEIETNNYNLNISRYVSTAKSEVIIDLQAVNATLTELEKKAKKAADTHNKFLKELGLPCLPVNLSK
jgi:type I restriction enzyme M protein